MTYMWLDSSFCRVHSSLPHTASFAAPFAPLRHKRGPNQQISHFISLLPWIRRDANLPSLKSPEWTEKLNVLTRCPADTAEDINSFRFPPSVPVNCYSFHLSHFRPVDATQVHLLWSARATYQFTAWPSQYQRSIKNTREVHYSVKCVSNFHLAAIIATFILIHPQMPCSSTVLIKVKRLTRTNLGLLTSKVYRSPSSFILKLNLGPSTELLVSGNDQSSSNCCQLSISGPTSGSM